ncbi:MAG TPA: phosphoglycerate mutase family protein [Xanthomonadales bacterium]|nr:phosphoglycerate mutase family protein [Xanthomonadales bacterium]
MAERGWRSCLWMAIALAACANLAAGQPPDTAEQEPGYRLVLVRHAEKMRGPDPGLNETGRARAQFLAHWLAEDAIQAIWTSDYKRTRQTAQALAERLSLDTRIYDPTDQQALVDLLRSEGTNALVVGHSNTLPELAGLLCGCPVPELSEADYERGWQLVTAGGSTTLSELDFRELWTDRTAISD